MTTAAQPQHPLIQKLTEVVRIARESSQPAAIHEGVLQYANEIAAFIAGALAPKAEPVVTDGAPLAGPGFVPDGEPE